VVHLGGQGWPFKAIVEESLQLTEQQSLAPYRGDFACRSPREVWVKPMFKLLHFCVADNFVDEYARLQVASGGGRSERHITITAS